MFVKKRTYREVTLDLTMGRAKDNAVPATNEHINSLRRSFSLNKIAAIVSQYRPPAAHFDPSRDYTHTYALCTIVDGNIGEEGHLTVRRTAADNHTVLDIDHARRGTSGFFHYTQARIRCRQDTLATPLSWTLRSKLATQPDGTAHLLSDIVKEGRIDNDTLFQSIGGRQSQRQLQGPITSPWCLIDALARMTHDQEPLQFALLDTMDTLLPNHRLSVGEMPELTMAGESRALRSFYRLGPGALPTVYWTETSGRPLFIIAGEEVYLLKEAGGTKAEYPMRRLEMNLAEKEGGMP